MKDLKYYALGKKDSPLLREYFDKYYNLLLKKIKKLSNIGILKKEFEELVKNNNNKNFILNADISSIINLLYLEYVIKKPQFINNIYEYEKILKEEIGFFLKEGINSDKLLMNQGKKIAGTEIKLTSVDNNPYNGREAHPEHILDGAIPGNWGKKSEKEWLEIYEKTFNLLKKVDEGIYDELNQIIKKIIPLGTARGHHNSASYKECIGHLYLGYTIDSDKPEINNLEAIIHESSHNKLNLLKQFDPILLNDMKEKYYSAIRPDARHIHGVFLGYHAFAPTMYIVMKAYRDGYLGDDRMWFDKIVLYYIKTKFLQKVIKKYAKLTDLGKEISEEIDFIISKMDALLKELKPTKQQLQEAKAKQMQHFTEVNRNYPYLEY